MGPVSIRQIDGFGKHPILLQSCPVCGAIDFTATKSCFDTFFVCVVCVSVQEHKESNKNIILEASFFNYCSILVENVLDL